MPKRKGYRGNRRKKRSNRRKGTPLYRLPRGDMAVSFDTERVITINTGENIGWTFIGDHPNLGVAGATGGAGVDDKWGDLSQAFQYFKPLGVLMQYQPHYVQGKQILTGSGGTVTTSYQLFRDMVHCYDNENTLGVMQSSIGINPSNFLDWMLDKENDRQMSPYKAHRIYRRVAPRTRVEADGTVVKSIKGGYYSTSFAPAYGYNVFGIQAPASVTSAQVVGVFKVRWTGILKMSGAVNPPT